MVLKNGYLYTPFKMEFTEYSLIACYDSSESFEKNPKLFCIYCLFEFLAREGSMAAGQSYFYCSSATPNNELNVHNCIHSIFLEGLPWQIKY